VVTQFIDFVFQGPPDPTSALSLVEVVDQDGQKIELGQWFHDGAFWRYRIPTELVPRMVLPVDAAPRYQEPRIQQAYEAGLEEAITLPLPLPDPRAARAALLDRVKSAPKKEGAQTSMAPIPSPPADREKCSNCGEPYDPREHEMLDCPQCGEGRCTAKCLPTATEPCLDCQALAAGPEEGGYDPAAAAPAKPKAAPAPPPGVFSPGFSPALAEELRQKGKSAEVDDEDGE
jgi:predicted  nucleic acid-binding Zn-ribbon protein